MSSAKHSEQLIPNIVINRYLECPVCLDFAVSPIYTCNNGHIVCGICQENTEKCPTCQAVNLSVNEFIEKILKSEEVVLPCRNSPHGCTLKIRPSDMKEPLKSSCDFRPIKCTESSCEGKSYNPKDLFQHWLDRHKIDEIACEQQVNTSPGTISNLIGTLLNKRVTQNTEFKLMNLQRVTNRSFPYRTEYFELDSRKFFFHSRVQNKTIHHWVTLLGEESDANCYNYSATVDRSDTSESAKKNIQVHGIPIHSLQYYDFESADALGHTVAVRLNSLVMLQEKQPINPTDKFNWNIRIEIYKISKDPVR